MPNSAKPAVKPHRVPPHAAGGLDDEITAQPRSPSDERGFADGGNAGLSVEPEDMGRRWLSEATEQGEALQRARLESELGLTEGPDTDAALMPPNFERENTLWEQTVDLVTETNNAADQLRGPGFIEDESEFEGDELAERLEVEAAERASLTRTANSSDVREFSLLDDVAPDGENTIAPDIDSQQQNEAERRIPRAELGAQVDPDLPRSARVGAPSDPRRDRAQERLPRLRRMISKVPRRAAEPVLRTAAAALRRLAGRSDRQNP